VKGNVRILGTVALLAVLAWAIDWSKLATTFSAVDSRLCLLALAVLTTAQVISSWRWQMLARILDFGGSVGRFIAYYFIGMLFNLFLPTSVGGDVVRAWYLASQEETPSSPTAGRPAGRRLAAFLSVFAERFSGVLMLLLLACVSACFCPIPLPGWLVRCVAGIGIASVAGVLALPSIMLLTDRKDRLPTGGVLGRAVQWFFRSRSVESLVAMVRRYGSHRGVIGLALALSVVVQLGSVLQFGLLARSMGLEIPWLYLGVVVPLVSLLTLLPISINGIGLRAAATVVLLGPVGVSKEQAVMLSALGFTLIVLISLAGGLSCYLFGHFPRFAASRGRQPPELVANELVREKAVHEDRVRDNPDQGRARQPPAAA